MSLPQLNWRRSNVLVDPGIFGAPLELDIVRGNVAIVRGCSPVSLAEPVPFRFGAETIDLRVASYFPVEHLLRIDLEPGPDAPAGGCDIVVFVAGATPHVRRLARRDAIRAIVPPLEPGLHDVRILCTNASSGDPGVPNERVLRIFDFDVRPLFPDVVARSAGVRVAGPWHALENALETGESFRWANRGARIVVTNDALRSIELDVQFGATFAHAKRVLSIRDRANDFFAGDFDLPERRRIRIPLPPAPRRPCELVLDTEHAAPPVPGDARSLVFRAFHIGPR